MAVDCSLPIYEKLHPWECAPKSIMNDAITNMAKALLEGYDALLRTFMTSWLGKGVQVDLDGLSVQWFTESTSIITLFLVTIGLMIAGFRTFTARNGQPLAQVSKQLLIVIFISSGGALLAQTFIVGGDAYGKWIIESAGLDASSFFVTIKVVNELPGVAIILGFFGILAVLCQWVLMFIRGALLPVLIGFWPVGAASSMLESKSSKMFDGITAWIIAFIIYSPVAASIYALAWRLKGGGDGLPGVINGWTLIILAVVALPAIMRLVAPAANAMGKMAGGAMAMGITAGIASAGVAVGAAVATGGASAAGKGAATGMSSASGKSTQGGPTSGASTSPSAEGGQKNSGQDSASAKQAAQGGAFSDSDSSSNGESANSGEPGASISESSGGNSSAGGGPSESSSTGASNSAAGGSKNAPQGRRASRADSGNSSSASGGTTSPASSGTGVSGAPAGSKTGSGESASDGGIASPDAGASGAPAESKSRSGESASSGAATSAPTQSSDSQATNGSQENSKTKHLAGKALEGLQNRPQSSNAAEGLISDE